MSLVCGGRRVDPIVRMLPNDEVFGLLMKVDVIKEHPKSEELPNVGYGDNRACAMIDLEDPSVPREGLTDLPILSS